jgi:hypothetical protein
MHQKKDCGKAFTAFPQSFLFFIAQDSQTSLACVIKSEVCIRTEKSFVWCNILLRPKGYGQQL